jgi:hypothetical protein
MTLICSSSDAIVNARPTTSSHRLPLVIGKLRPDEHSIARAVKSVVKLDSKKLQALTTLLYEAVANSHAYAPRTQQRIVTYEAVSGTRHKFEVTDEGNGILTNYRLSPIGSTCDDRTDLDEQLLTKLLGTQRSSNHSASAGWGTVYIIRRAKILDAELSLFTDGYVATWSAAQYNADLPPLFDTFPPVLRKVPEKMVGTMWRVEFAN